MADGPDRSIEEEQDAFVSLFSSANLRRTWRTLRRELREATSRDAVDWVDWATRIEASLEVIRSQVISGDYSPSPATRIEAGKNKGSFRVMTSLNIRDALIYRHICDHALKIALPRKVAGAYFSKRRTRTPIGRTFEPTPYVSDTFFAIWLRYNEYRSRTLLNEPYEILVITDISNYFDSIQHELLFEYLAPLGLPRKAVGLLGRLLEYFRPESGHSPSPKVGIPVDELDCSRELAHIFLFEHDRRIVDKFGEANYVRWMDDQNIGVRNYAEGRKVINEMTRSLAQQRLTLNSGKTKFLAPEEVALHFQLDLNEELNEWNSRFEQSRWQMSKKLRNELTDLWIEGQNGPSADVGNWNKVLKRFYAYCARANLPIMEARAGEDLVNYPELAERILMYYARRNRGQLILDLFTNYCVSSENLFESVETRFFESLLLLDPSQDVQASILALARDFAAGSSELQTGRPLGRATAILCLYWFGESIDVIQNLYSLDEGPSLPKEVARAWLACSAALDPGRTDHPINALFGHSSDDVLSLVRFFRALVDGQISSLGNYKSQKPRWPLPGKFYDARGWMLLELASHGPDQNLLQTTRQDFNSFRRLIRTEPERTVASRIADRLELPLEM